MAAIISNIIPNIIPDLQLFTNILPLAFFGALGLACLGAPFIAVFSEIVAKKKKKIFYDKYAQQIASMGLTTGVFSLFGIAAGLFTLVGNEPGGQTMLINPASGLVPVYASILLEAVFMILYCTTWKRLKKNKPVHVTFGILSVLSSVLVLYTSLSAILFWLVAGPGTSTVLPLYLAQIPPSLAHLVPPLAAMGMFLALALATGLSLTWLVIRRNKDDFGRDYYKFSMNYAALLALIFTLCLVAPSAWIAVLFKPEFLMAKLMGGYILFLAPALILSTIWIFVMRSQAPLRLKPAVFLSILFLWACQNGALVLCIRIVQPALRLQ